MGTFSSASSSALSELALSEPALSESAYSFLFILIKRAAAATPFVNKLVPFNPLTSISALFFALALLALVPALLALVPAFFFAPALLVPAKQVHFPDEYKSLFVCIIL